MKLVFVEGKIQITLDANEASSILCDLQANDDCSYSVETDEFVETLEAAL